MRWDIEFYEPRNGGNPVLEFIQSMPPRHQAKIYREIDLLEEFGVDLEYPHTANIRGERYRGLWELRIRFGSDASRIFYFLPAGRTFVLLHGFVKKTNETPTRELEIAKRRMDDFIGRRALS